MTWDIVALIILTLLCLVLAIANIKLRFRNRNLVVRLAQEAVDKRIIEGLLNEELARQDSQAIEQSEGFLRFISQSRDWAFSYIEQVQSAILNFKQKVGPKIIYAKTYGSATVSPHTQIIDSIAEAYEELIAVLPEDSADDVVK